MDLFKKVCENLKHATTWMDFENIMQIERSQSQNMTCMTDSYKMSRTGKSIEKENRLVIAYG